MANKKRRAADLARAPFVFVTRGLVVIFESEVGDQFLSLEVTQRVLQLHQLDEHVVLRIQAGSRLRALEVE